MYIDREAKFPKGNICKSILEELIVYIAENRQYIICLDFKFYSVYIIWIADEKDEVLVNDDLKIVAFKTEIELRSFWTKRSKEDLGETTTYSIYKLQQWLLNPHSGFDSNVFLNLWNLFTDVAESIKKTFIGDAEGDIRDIVYDKLFATSGLFIVEDPNPIFDIDEIKMLSEVLQNGLDLFLNNLDFIKKKSNLNK